MARSKTFAFARGRSSRSKSADKSAGPSNYSSSPSPLFLNNPSALFPDHEQASKAHRLLGTSSTASDGWRGSDHSAATHRLCSQPSTATLRSHYDAKQTPLSISQQTSDSAVRDRALRRGKPTVLANQVDTPPKDYHKSKPVRLDLAKLFPKPRAGHAHALVQPILSPEHLVSSPVAMSTASDYFAQQLTCDPTPDRDESWPSNPSTRTAVLREYNLAKVIVRRPPKGVQHWFDALDDDSDEAPHDVIAPLQKAQKAGSKLPLDYMLRDTNSARSAPRLELSTQQQSDCLPESFAHDDIVTIDRRTSPSLYSVNTHHSLVSSTIKTSALSKADLRDSSVLSFSSSEDEDVTSPRARRFSVRNSLDFAADADDIIIGQACAFKVSPQMQKSSAAKSRSRSSTSTRATTIEVVYTPELPLVSNQYQGQCQRKRAQSGSRRSSHVRQPSVIHEDDDGHFTTDMNTPPSISTPSLSCMRVPENEASDRRNGSRKLMAVTAEEEALLELMRKKRAELQQRPAPLTTTDNMAKDGLREPHGRCSSRTLEEMSFLTSQKTAKLPDNEISSTSGLGPFRSSPPIVDRKISSNISTNGATSATDDTPFVATKLSKSLSSPAKFSPLELFPSPSPNQSSSPPTPLTPGPHVNEMDAAVEIACSDANADADESILFRTTVADPLLSHGDKSDSSRGVPGAHLQHRRTYSTGADIQFQIPSSTLTNALIPVFEACPEITDIMPGNSSIQASEKREMIMENSSIYGQPKRSDTKQSYFSSSARRVSAHLQGADPALVRADEGGSRWIIATSNSAQTIPCLRNNSTGKRHEIRQNEGGKTSYNASDDVLAAWSSLGGTL